MAEVSLSIGGHLYRVSCREGEAAHLLNMGALVDAKTVEARTAVGGLSEVRQLLYASLLLADEVAEGRGKTPAAASHVSPSLVEALATRIEAVAAALEHWND